METTPVNAAGSEHVPMPSSDSSTVTRSASEQAANSSGGGKHRQSWLYRRFLKSGLVEPVRKVLKPLLIWVFKPHIAVTDDTGRRDLVDIDLKPPSAVAIAWWTVFGPLIFLMLLPLILILIPVVMVVGLAAILVAAMQTDADVSQRRPLITRAAR